MLSVRRTYIFGKKERSLINSMARYIIRGHRACCLCSVSVTPQSGLVAAPSFLSSLFTIPSTPSLCHFLVQPNETAVLGYAFVITKKEENQSLGLFGPGAGRLPKMPGAEQCLRLSELPSLKMDGVNDSPGTIMVD